MERSTGGREGGGEGEEEEEGPQPAVSIIHSLETMSGWWVGSAGDGGATRRIMREEKYHFCADEYTVTLPSAVLPLLRPKQSEAARGFCLRLRDWFR